MRPCETCGKPTTDSNAVCDHSEQLTTLCSENATLRAEVERLTFQVATLKQSDADQVIEYRESWKSMRDDVLSLLITASLARYENVMRAIDRHDPGGNDDETNP